MLKHLRNRVVMSIKSAIYGRRGEPYRIAGHTLRYLPGSRPVRVSYKHSDNPVNRYDALQVELLVSGIAPGDTVLDIGAHAGQYSIMMAALSGPAGRVVAFEPDPYARELLLRNVALNPGLKPPTVEAVALADAAGEAVLYSRGGNSQSSLASSGVGSLQDGPSEQIRVQTMTLDTYIARAGLSTPAWVKLDTEGAEINILRGAEKLLAGPTRIICELHPYTWPEFGTSVDELRAIVAASGRRMGYLGSGDPVSGDAQYGTVLIDRAG